MAKEEERPPKACLYCGKELTKRERQKVIRGNRKFCNGVCRSRYNSNHYFLMLKTNPEFRAKRLREHTAWRNKNRVKVNNYFKVYMRTYKKKIKDALILTPKDL